MPEHSHLPTKAFIAVLMLCLMLLTIAEMSGFFPAAETQPDKKLHSYAENLADQLHPLITTYNQSAQLAVLSNGLSDHPAILSLVIETLEGEMQRAVAPQTDSALQTDLIQLPIGTGSETVGTLSVSYIETNAESAWSSIEIMIVSLWALLASVILYLLFSENHNLGLNSS
ncbi:MAG: hypothetical protein JAZ05_00595, partial [Candidatus Thiodiazotropha taylori]|nr:hypothetical protein [Candidatus Thiodiazotropha taylori]MCW4290502.1 hypothetical protein [Candidatus Thiodiazotropha taylori]